ncbi:hypothetical protein FHR20_002904 [Sphingomonas leidyi]|uniref:Glycerophosphoryl diester phosphodiesterase membrane domain-containing protein n=1 Tax=Sphingomonas leidyi TaxID=68569 RepID=A0A7X5V2D1_9SPHN|nr:hypothetical protein [Sphingomonas leidyi]
MGSILGGAFGLLRERPGAVVIWAVTYCVGSLAISLIMGLLMFGTVMPASADAGAALSVWAGPMFSLMLLLYLCLLLLVVVLMNAVFRAMLRPQEGGFAFMRLGMDEFRMLGLVVLVCVGVFAAVLIGELLLLLLITIIGFALGTGAIAGAISVVLALAFLCAMVWLEVRISLIFPLSFHRRRMSLDAAWELTRGRFWLLFACYFLIGLIFAVATGIVMWAVMGEYFVALIQANGDQEQMRLAAEAFAAKQFAMPLAAKILFGVVGAVFFAVGLALGPGLLASATRELLGDESEAAVFAAESDGSVMD